MFDPVSEIVSLLQPKTPSSKKLVGRGNWVFRRHEVDRPHYAIVLDGICALAIDDQPPVTLAKGDFVLIPSANSFLLSGHGIASDLIDETQTVLSPFECVLGDPGGAQGATLLTGHCAFASPDVDILLALLPRLVHVRDEPRLSTLVRLVDEEVETERPARDAVLGGLLELLFIEALRSTASIASAPNLLRGLADERVATALRSMHQNPRRKWTVGELARDAALSRSAFFERFQEVVGTSPVEYLIVWRMALAKRYLREKEASLSEIAEKLGYRTANSFSIAFTRRFGVPPTKYAELELRLDR
jgi:AraC-like DNA-binding protein